MSRRLGAGELGRFPGLRLALLSLSAASLGFALAGPHWGLGPDQGHSSSLNIVLALDVSNSMRVTDSAPSRLVRERLLATRLLSQLEGNRIGLVAFAGQAYVLSPLTVDHSALQLYVDALNPGLLSAGGTALSAALRQAVDVVRGDDTGSRNAVVLVSDGEDLEQQSLAVQAAERAAHAGVVVNTVGVGTAAGGRIPDVDPVTGQTRGWMKDPVSGQVVISRMDAPLLRRIARITGGTYVHLGDAGATNHLVSVLSGMERGVTDSSGQRLAPVDRTAWFVGLALLLLALDTLLARREATPAGALFRLRGDSPAREA